MPKEGTDHLQKNGDWNKSRFFIVNHGNDRPGNDSRKTSMHQEEIISNLELYTLQKSFLKHKSKIKILVIK